MKTKFHTRFKMHELEINPADVAVLMSYADDVPEPIEAMILSELENLKEISDIEAGYEIFPASTNKAKNEIAVSDTVFEVGKTVGIMFKNIEQLAICVGTAGKVLSNRSKALMDKGDVLEGYVVDIIGSMVVEKAVDMMQEELQKDLERQGLNITNRYSPGYCEWDIAEQHKLFALLPEKFCNVQLLDSALMMPIKSVSGMIGIGKNVRFHKYNCNACTQTTCIYRNKKQTNPA